MNISATQNMKMAMQAVGEHRFRSLLTMLGIVIGITTVVTVASLLTGLRAGVVTFFQELGPDNIFVYKTSGDPSQEPPKERKRRPMKPEYAEFIRRWSTSVEDVGLQLYIPPVVDGKPITARVPGFESENINVAGQSPNMGEISPRDFAAGRFFTPEEDQRAAHVAVIGANVADSLFPGGTARRRHHDDGWRRVHHHRRLCQGEGRILRRKRPGQRHRHPAAHRREPLSAGGPLHDHRQGEDRQAARRRSTKWRASCAASAAWPPTRKDDFAISTPDQIIQQFDRITGLIGLVAIAISALGLLVGGIGVMNIMLVSVTERTREIGVRKALGARRRDIVGQFLVEAMTLTGAGGVLGIVIAVLITMLVGALVPSLPSKVPSWALITGFSVSVIVGVFFGVWPAVKAAQLDPVEALRYE